MSGSPMELNLIHIKYSAAVILAFIVSRIYVVVVSLKHYVCLYDTWLLPISI